MTKETTEAIDDAFVNEAIVAARAGLRDDWEWRGDVMSTVLVRVADERDALRAKVAAQDAADRMNDANHDALLRRLDAMAAENARLRDKVEKLHDLAGEFLHGVYEDSDDIARGDDLLAEIKAGA